MYLTWSAMSNSPNQTCKPDWQQLVGGGHGTDATVEGSGGDDDDDDPEVSTEVL